MTTELVKHQKQEQNWTPQQVEELKTTIGGGRLSEAQFHTYCYAIKRTGLDPFMKQIYAVVHKNHKDGTSRMTIIVGIDGYRLIADRTGLYAGNDDPLYEVIGQNSVHPTKATVAVYKVVSGLRCAFTAAARWDEYYPGDAKGAMWRKMPYLMLGKVAEALALRKAFPAELSGLYTSDEMDQAEGTPARDAEIPHHGHLNAPQGHSETHTPPEILPLVKKILEFQSQLGMQNDELQRMLAKEVQCSSLKNITLDQANLALNILSEELEIMTVSQREAEDLS